MGQQAAPYCIRHFGLTLRHITSVGSLQAEEHLRAGSLLALTTALFVRGMRKHLVR